MDRASNSILACSVRNCGRPLLRRESTWICENEHAFDVARSGYVNLLQPQDRRSLDAGDSRIAVVARRALLDAQFGAALLDALAEALAALEIPPGALALDLGCGDGHFLAALCERFQLDGVGLDLSTHAVDRAAKRHESQLWIAANADRRLPIVDGTVALVLSIDGRRPRDQIARVLTPCGHLIVAVPAEDDLHELRSAVLGEAHALDRSERVVAELAPEFERVAHRVARARVKLDRESLERLAAATYRCGRTRERESLQRIQELELTTSHDVLTFRRKA